MKNWAFFIREGWWAVLVHPQQNYTGRKRKNKTFQLRFMVETYCGFVDQEAVSRAWMMLTGRGRNCVGG